MARTPKVLSADESVAIVDAIRDRVADFDFQKNYLVPTDETDPRPARIKIAEVVGAASDAFEDILIEPRDERQRAFNAWMSKYISPAGRVRILDSLRQKKAARARTMGKNDGQTQALMTPFASATFADLAAEAGLTKKKFFDQLARWLSHEREGKLAMQRFEEYLKLGKWERT